MSFFSGLPSAKEAEILSLLLSGREMYGLEMVKASNGALKRGTIYVVLDRLEKEGYVSSRLEKIETVSGLPRRQYRITGLGQRALAARAAAKQVMQPSLALAGG